MINLLYIDLSCGAGGTSSGVEYAKVDGEKCAEVIACVNHDKNAILSHQANHPDTLHFTEDIRTLELGPMMAHLAAKKAEYPEAHVVLLAHGMAAGRGVVHEEAEDHLDERHVPGPCGGQGACDTSLLSIGRADGDRHAPV